MKNVQLLEQRELTNHSAQQAKAKCGAARKRGANHLLCAAARRKRLQRRPKTSGDDRKAGGAHILGHLKFQHFLSGHGPFDMHFNI